MKTKTTYRRAAGARSTGFTLTELLVVVAIIAILIGLVVPTVNVVRKQAKATATRATLGAMETGLETYKADGKIGGGYPPSFSDNEANRGEVVSPYVPGNTQSRIRMTGAGLLVWAMAGADLLGTPGFRPFAGGTQWSLSTGSGGNHAYALSTDKGREGQPVQARSGPYIDLSRTKVTPAEGDKGFIVPLERESGDSRPPRPYPSFLDAWGQPILYWRADPAGRAIASKDRLQSPRGIYSHEDNAALVTSGGPEELKLNSSGEPHLLDWNNDPNVPRSFQSYIRNQQVTARPEPARPDSYLVVTAGPDGTYGTADDIDNFDHQGK